MSALDPIELQVITGALRAACEEMGVALIHAAHSSNIKERHDASTGLFDADGQMTMQAEHIPVHLGSMPASVAAVLGERHAPGVSWILNDPFAGGTHLPDITVVTPVFSGDGQALLGFAASRAHHADVGGRVPGSMPADSHTLAEEGVVISPRRLDEAAIDELVARMRQPAERRADLRAQLAANRIGAQRLGALAERLGHERLREASDAVLDYAERRTRACVAALPDGELLAEDLLEGRDGDLQLKLRVRIEGERLLLDFDGSAAQHDGNLNCPLAVTRSACYFAVRVLTDPDIPPSAGAYRPVDVRAPLGSLLNARPGAAVAGGNVETSSRVADLVLGAFGRALGQGTMNNLTLGAEQSADGDGDGESFSYYETLGGGQGACAEADGPSGVHVAMSNTLNTPIEALEREFPLRVVQYALRRGSGGAGRTHGGDGVVRELEALREMTFSLIAERRRHPPRGADGGEPGERGRDTLDGVQLPGKLTGTLRAGQRLRIETPGGGGFGRRSPATRPTSQPAPSSRMRQTFAMATGGSQATDAGTPKHGTSIYIAFVPWILFSIITRRLEVESAAVVALVASIAICIPSLRSGRPKLLELGAVVAFVGFTIVALAGDDATRDWLARYARAISAALLALIAFGSLAATPFTEQYARESVPRELWGTAAFRQINRRITAMWGAVFLLMVPSHIIAGAIDTRRAFTIFNWVIPIVLIVFAVKWTSRLSGDQAESETGLANAP